MMYSVEQGRRLGILHTTRQVNKTDLNISPYRNFIRYIPEINLSKALNYFVAKIVEE